MNRTCPQCQSTIKLQNISNEVGIVEQEFLQDLVEILEADSAIVSGDEVTNWFTPVHSFNAKF